MIQVSKDERDKIIKLGEYMTHKWEDRPNTRENLIESQKETIGRYQDIGFEVEVDIAAALLGLGPFSIAIIRRVENKPDDHELLRKEIMKSYERDGKLKGGKLKKDLKRD